MSICLTAATEKVSGGMEIADQTVTGIKEKNTNCWIILNDKAVIQSGTVWPHQCNNAEYLGEWKAVYSRKTNKKDPRADGVFCVLTVMGTKPKTPMQSYRINTITWDHKREVRIELEACLAVDMWYFAIALWIHVISGLFLTIHVILQAPS